MYQSLDKHETYLRSIHEKGHGFYIGIGIALSPLFVKDMRPWGIAAVNRKDTW